MDIPLEDSRFVKNGKTLLDGLLQFQQTDGGFCHMIDSETEAPWGECVHIYTD